MMDKMAKLPVPKIATVVVRKGFGMTHRLATGDRIGKGGKGR
jgi:hypothetical protein